MFKHIQRRAAAGLMASAVVLAQVISTVPAFATNTGTINGSSFDGCNNTYTLQSIYTEDQTWRDAHPAYTENGKNAPSESGYMIEVFGNANGDSGIMMHFAAGNPGTIYWRPAYQAMTAQDNVVITIPLSGSNWSTTLTAVQNGVLGYKGTTSWYDIFRQTTGSTPATGATYGLSTDGTAAVVMIPHMNAGDFWMSSYAVTITDPTVKAKTGIFDSGKTIITSTMTDKQACTPKPAPQPAVSTEWRDVESFTCGMTEVKQTRTTTTYTVEWDAATTSWKQVPTDTLEMKTRPATAEELASCNGGIDGTVYWDNDTSKEITEGDTPYANKTVTLIDQTTGEIIATTTTDADGYYVFTDLPTGSYTVYITLVDGEEVATTPVKVADVVVEYRSLTSVDFGLMKPGKGATVPVVPTTPGETPKTATPLPLPAELPHTGTSYDGVIVALVAAISTYGAVFFAQKKYNY